MTTAAPESSAQAGDAGATPGGSSAVTQRRVVGACCGGCGCGVVFLVATVGLLITIALGRAVEAMREHVERVAAGEVEAAHAACTDDFRAATGLEAFEGFVAAHPEIYEATDLEVRDRALEDGVATLRVVARGPDGAAHVRFELVEERGVWRIRNVWAGD